MERMVTIDGKEYNMKANGATPRVYRSLFKAEIFAAMQNAIDRDNQIKDSEVFENLAFCMAYQGGAIPQGMTIDEWLEGMSSPMAVINAAPAIIELWTDETATTVAPKKE